MSNNTVVIYGAGASYASGYKINLSSEGTRCSENPLMDKNFFSNKNILKLIETKYYALRKFIEFYYGGMDNIKSLGLEELWTAVDLNHKHIKLGTYMWDKETKKYQEDYFHSGGNRYPYQDVFSHSTYSYSSGRRAQIDSPIYNKCKFLGDCLRDLKGLINDSLSDFGMGGSENYYQELHALLNYKKNRLLGYITFNYDILLEESLHVMNIPFRYVGMNENIYDYTFLEGNLPIIKLHGSLNWEYVSSDIPVQQNKKIETVVPKHMNMDGSVSESAIIPPTLLKQEINDESRARDKDTLTQIILQQWRAAIRLIWEADSLVIIGYSFPTTDFHAKRIFQIATMWRRLNNKSKTKVLYCGGDKSDDAKNKLEGIFGQENEIIIKNKFEKLCGSEEIKQFLA